MNEEAIASVERNMTDDIVFNTARFRSLPEDVRGFLEAADPHFGWEALLPRVRWYCRSIGHVTEIGRRSLREPITQRPSPVATVRRIHLYSGYARDMLASILKHRGLGHMHDMLHTFHLGRSLAYDHGMVAGMMGVFVQFEEAFGDHANVLAMGEHTIRAARVAEMRLKEQRHFEWRGLFIPLFGLYSMYATEVCTDLACGRAFLQEMIDEVLETV